MSTRLRRVKDIPTIAHLYRTKRLAPVSSGPTEGNQEYNNKICTLQYDITELEVDAIVNAANARLAGGGGVDGAIHMRAGPRLLAECRLLNGCDTGSAKITDAYNLPCKKVIHAVGPVYSTAEKSEPLLRECYRTALRLAVQNGCTSIAFCAISTGIYGYPRREAAKAALRETMFFLRGPQGKKLEKIIFCSYLDQDADAYAEMIPKVFAPTKEDLAESVSATLETHSHLGDDDRKDQTNRFRDSMLPSISWKKPPANFEQHGVQRSYVGVGFIQIRGEHNVENAYQIQYMWKENQKAINTFIDTLPTLERSDTRIGANVAESGMMAETLHHSGNLITEEPVDEGQDKMVRNLDADDPEGACGEPATTCSIIDLSEEDPHLSDVADDDDDIKGGAGHPKDSSNLSPATRDGMPDQNTVKEQYRTSCAATAFNHERCIHLWRVEDGEWNYRLWPQGQIQCMTCHHYMAPAKPWSQYWGTKDGIML